MKRDFLTLSDLGPGGIERILDLSKRLAETRKTSAHPKPLAGRSVALVFEKASTRTRVSLEIAVYELGGHPVVLTSQGSQIARGEPIADTSRVLDRMVDVIALRTFSTARLNELATVAKVPVINALTDDAHPLQLLADLYTVRGVRGKLAGLKYAWIGDGNNMARSWIESARLLGLDLVLACPAGFEPPAGEVEAARRAGANVKVVSDPAEACRGADVISTDVWASMGQEDEQEGRRRIFANYRVTSALVGKAARDVVVLHCLPAHRGEEIDEDVIEGPRSFVWDQAEARLHTAKAVLMWTLGRV
ncbi:MAG: ornithine carbamoyltransferase [Polyangiaceae bacterium]